MFDVVMGEHDYTDIGGTTIVRRGVKRIVMHPDWNPRFYDFDYALLELKEDLDFCAHKHIRPICYPRGTPGPGHPVRFF